MFLLVSSVAHDTMSVNKEIGKSPARDSENGEINRDIVREKGAVRQMKVASKDLLLQIARDAITCHLEDRIPSKLPGLDAELLQKLGAFITLQKGDQLRGCVGQITSDKPLYETVAQAAIAAATRDPRFHQVDLLEMPELTIEISVLTPLQPLEHLEDLEIGTHGLYIKNDTYSGLLLPQVATAYNWDRIQFLQQACKKAQLPEEAWQDPETEIYLFSSQAFGEGA